jgi:hypothetical protein
MYCTGLIYGVVSWLGCMNLVINLDSMPVQSTAMLPASFPEIPVDPLTIFVRMLLKESPILLQEHQSDH